MAEKKTTSKKFCKKILYGNKLNPRLLYGIIVGETADYILFQTDKREYRIYNWSILSIEDTDMPFRVVMEDE